mmetsp:Transcript_98623/g.279319  ORF Transcript_98623/g.279319 Transcript_98623/m.279319 type:complete len:398 (-) Transcript_98623:354-1547(-)
MMAMRSTMFMGVFRKSQIVCVPSASATQSRRRNSRVKIPVKNPSKTNHTFFSVSLISLSFGETRGSRKSVITETMIMMPMKTDHLSAASPVSGMSRNLCSWTRLPQGSVKTESGEVSRDISDWSVSLGAFFACSTGARSRCGSPVCRTSCICRARTSVKTLVVLALASRARPSGCSLGSGGRRMVGLSRGCSTAGTSRMSSARPLSFESVKSEHHSNSSASSSVSGWAVRSTRAVAVSMSPSPPSFLPMKSRRPISRHHSSSCFLMKREDMATKVTTSTRPLPSVHMLAMPSTSVWLMLGWKHSRKRRTSTVWSMPPLAASSYFAKISCSFSTCASPSRAMEASAASSWKLASVKDFSCSFPSVNIVLKMPAYIRASATRSKGSVASPSSSWEGPEQ